MANSKVTPTEYVAIANAYANIYDNLTGIEDEAKTAVEAVVDITTSSHESYTGDPDSGLNAELILLDPSNGAYLSAQNISSSTSNFLPTIRALNNLAIEGADTGTTDTEKLTDFVNNEAFNGTCVPLGWVNFCELAGYTVTSWNSCSS